MILWQLEMGIYLSAPKTDKVSEDGGNDRLRFGASSMQGWRSTMEDAVSLFKSAADYFCLFSLCIFVIISHAILAFLHIKSVLKSQTHR